MVFIHNKYTRIYYSIISKAQSQCRQKNRGTYYESHHIIPRCMGGTETVLLSAREHMICHWLLTKMVDGELKYKMCYGFGLMVHACNRKQERIFSSRVYEIARLKVSEANSKRPVTDEARAKISAFKKGRKFSDEHKAKISAAARKRKHSPETRAKMIESQKRRQARERGVQ